MPKTLYNDKHNSIADICKTLHISRSTLYRYVTVRQKEAGPKRVEQVGDNVAG